MNWGCSSNMGPVGVGENYMLLQDLSNLKKVGFLGLYRLIFGWRLLRMVFYITLINSEIRQICPQVYKYESVHYFCLFNIY
jgi:hypothetical protein